MGADDNERRLQERWRLEQQRRAEREAAERTATEQERERKVDDAGRPTADDLQDLAEDFAKKLDEFAQDHGLPTMQTIHHGGSPGTLSVDLLHSPDLSGLTTQVGMSDHTQVSAMPLQEQHGDALMAVLAIVHVTTQIAAQVLEWRDQLLEREQSERGQPERATSEPERSTKGRPDATAPEQQTRVPAEAAAEKQLTEELAALDKQYTEARAQREAELRDTMNQVLSKNPDWVGNPDRMDQLKAVVESQLQKMDELHDEQRRDIQVQSQLVIEEDELHLHR